VNSLLRHKGEITLLQSFIKLLKPLAIYIDALHNSIYTLVVIKSCTFSLLLTRNLTMYADTPLRRPTFDASKAVAPITDFLARILDAFIEARRIEAARQTALHLTATNRDFANIGYHDLVQRLLDDRYPIYLDGSQASK
jgi:hypothetical protein